LLCLFAQFGLLETIVTDNGSSFTSEEFQYFFKTKWNKTYFLCHIPPINKWAGRKAVQIVKRGLKKVTQGSVKSRLAKILLAYRTTPHSTTCDTPAKLFTKQKPLYKTGFTQI